MRRRLFVILGGKESRDRNRHVSKSAKGQRAEPNLDILKESPCLRCELFVRDTACPHVKSCSKIDEFQGIAAVHCTLFKPHDTFSVARI